MPTAKIVKPQGEPDEFEQTISQVFYQRFSCAVVEFDTTTISMLSNARPLYSFVDVWWFTWKKIARVYIPGSRELFSKN